MSWIKAVKRGLVWAAGLVWSLLVDMGRKIVWLYNILPVRYLFLFVLEIALFAAVYAYYLPGHFYHSTVQHEDWMRVEREDIMAELKASMIKSYIQHFGGSTILRSDKKDDEWVANVQDMSLSHFRYEEGLILLSMKLPHQPEVTRVDYNMLGDDGPSEPEIRIEVADYREMLSQTQGRMPDEEVDLLMRIRTRSSDKPMEKLISKRGLGGQIVTGIVLLVPNSLKAKIAGYVGAMHGFPGHSAGSFPRMLYLSVVTITTLGYGDVVPITGSARFWVGLEAFAGYVTLGLYVWSLTSQRERDETREGRRQEAEGNAENS